MIGTEDFNYLEAGRQQTVISGFNIDQKAPVDARMVVETIPDMLQIRKRYPGIEVLVLNGTSIPTPVGFNWRDLVFRKFRYLGSDLDSETTNFSDWEELTTGVGGSGVTLEDIVVSGFEGTGLGEYFNGQVIPAGTNHNEIFTKILSQRVAATYLSPTLSLTRTSGSVPGRYEVGTSITLALSAAFTQNDAGPIGNLRIQQGGADLINSVSSPTTTNPTFTLGDGNTVFSAVADYAQGPVKQDNKGDDSPTGRIAAGSVSANELVFTGERFTWWSAALPANAAAVRALTSRQLGVRAGEAITLSIAQGQEGIHIIVPASLGVPKSILYREAAFLEVKSNFTQSTIAVGGANNFPTIQYNIFSYVPAVPFQSAVTYLATF